MSTRSLTVPASSRPPADDGLERTLLRAAAAHAADLAAGINPDTAGDTVALADQFEAQGLTFLAERGIEIRTPVDLPDA